MRVFAQSNWDDPQWAMRYFHSPLPAKILKLECPDGYRAITPEVVHCQGASIMLVHSAAQPEVILVLMQTMQYKYKFDYPPEVGESILESVKNIVHIVKALCKDWVQEDAIKYRLAGGLWN